jgi:hypothetical protein
MKPNTKLPTTGLLRLISYALPPIGLCLVFYWFSPNDILLAQWILALLLTTIPWVAYLNWKRNRDEKLPIFALIGFVYWIYYPLSLFWGARTVVSVETPFDLPISPDSISWSLVMAVTSVGVIWLGMRMRLGRRLVPGKLPDLKSGSRSLHYLRFLLVGSTLLSAWESFPFLAGPGGRQALTIMVSIVPLAAFGILFRRVLDGEARQLDRILVLGFLLLRFVIGLSSGWLGSFASIIVVCAAIYVVQRRRIPRFAFVVAIVFTLFFQVGKQEFRKVYWSDNTEASKVDRVKFWTEASLAKWQDAFSDPTGAAFADAVDTSLSRVSLLTQTANVVNLTPSTIPYQGGRLYSYLLVTWIPRAVWPDKPSINDANQFYQVAYGVSTHEGLETVSIGVGVMTEAYISFGWAGVLVIMFLMGVFYDVYRHLFFTESSGLLMTGLGIALLPQIINGEAQIAVYLAGLVQQVIFTLIIFSPVICWKSQQARRPFFARTSDHIGRAYLKPALVEFPQTQQRDPI